MIKLYTETLNDFLTRNSESQEWYQIKQKFDKFPRFNIGTIDFDMYTLFIDKYGISEIGAETENLFYFWINNKINELLIKYVPKINVYLSNFEKAIERKISLTDQGINENKLYPINVDKSRTATAVTFNGTKEQALLYFKSNAALLDEVLNIRDIYLDCLQAFEPCFMGVL